MILRARIVVSMSGRPTADGAVAVERGRIVAVGTWPEVRAQRRGPVLDLGERVLLPGLINAHCHLDYSHMAGLLRPPKHFTDWIQNIMALKASWSYSEFAQSWVEGARMLLRTGTTTVVDIEAVPELLPEVWTVTPLRVISLRELIHLKNHSQAVQLVDRTARECDALPNAIGRIGLSPHSPYAASAALLARAADVARRRGWLLATHLAESAEEFQMFTARKGRLHDWLEDQRDITDHVHGSPVQHMEQCRYLSPGLLAVHVNYLADGDASLLARRGVSVVHCPRSHSYFGHHPFPCDALTAAGVNICLGTDSLASTRRARQSKPELNLFEEMAALAKNQPGLSAERIVEMTTTAAARALHPAPEVGSLFPGARADLVVLPYTGPLEEVFERIVHHPGPVDGSMIDGRWTAELSCPSRAA